MSDQFVAEIRIFPFNFAPVGWAFCAGQLLPISQNTALFSLLGTTYGGDGRSTFALPNLQGSAALHTGGNQPGPGLSNYALGETIGSDNVTLLTSEMASHQHFFVSSTNAGTTEAPANNQLGIGSSGTKTQSFTANIYSTTPAQATTALSPQALGFTGGSQPHTNMMPYLTMNFCIAMQGIFPPRG